MRVTLCKAPTREPMPDHYTGNSVPYSLRQVRGFFNSPADHISKIQETGPMIYCTYPRRILSCVNWGIDQKFWILSCVVWGSEILNPLLCCLRVRNSESSPELIGGSEILNPLLCCLGVRNSESSPVLFKGKKFWILSCVNWGIRNSESSLVLFGGQKFWILSRVVWGVIRRLLGRILWFLANRETFAVSKLQQSSLKLSGKHEIPWKPQVSLPANFTLISRRTSNLSISNVDTVWSSQKKHWSTLNTQYFQQLIFLFLTSCAWIIVIFLFLCATLLISVLLKLFRHDLCQQAFFNWGFHLVLGSLKKYQELMFCNLPQRLSHLNLLERQDVHLFPLWEVRKTSS